MRSRTGLVVLVTFVLAAAAACTSSPGRRASPPPATTTAGHHATATTTAPGAAAKASPTQLRAQFEQLLGQHTLLAVRSMRSAVSANPAFRRVSDAALETNTETLSQLVASAYGEANGDRFKQLWQRCVADLSSYADAVARGGASGKQAARQALEADADAYGAWLAEASNGQVRESDAPSAMRAHLEQLVEQVDAYAARDYGKAYRIEREAYRQLFATGERLARSSVTPELAAGMDAPSEKLRSAFAMLLGEHMELITDAQRATFAGSQEFAAAAAQVNANSATLTEAMGAIVGPKKAAEFQTAWANHVEGLMAYSTAVAGKDEAGKVVAKENLDSFASRLALYLSDVVRNVLPVEPLTAALAGHDAHLIGQVDAYAAKNYAEAQRSELEGYQQMLGVATTLVGAIQRTVQMPTGGPQTGGGGTAHHRRG